MSSSRRRSTDSARPVFNPVASAVKSQIRRDRRAIVATAVLGGAIALPQTVAAQDEPFLEEIIVTATKRAESLQDVPISVSALSGTTIETLGIMNFEDYAHMLPTVSFKAVGPGTATIIMRGASDGGDGNPSGSQPSVGLYLDEAPVTTIASNLDIHIYDIERIEALAGPQGTLFGASSQSGNLRIITNKPNTDGFQAGVDLGALSTTGGDPGYSLEGFANIPLGDSTAIRLVGWYVDEGGWIDNVAGTRNYTLEGGYGYNTNNFGRTSSIDNAALVKDNFNELEKVGGRAALRVNLGDAWTLDASVIGQNLDTVGTWDHDPSGVGDRAIQRYFDDFNNDEFIQGNVTLAGEIGNNLLVYSGTIMDRDINYQSDYSQYGEDAYWVPYYACDYSATGADLATQSATDCVGLEEYYQETNNFERDTHELRLQSIGDSSFQYTVGAYYTEITHTYLLEWIQPSMSPNREVPPVGSGRAANDVFFRTDQKRADRQTALFGEVTYDFTDTFSMTAGARFFENKSNLSGIVGWGPALFGVNDTSVDANYEDKDAIYKLNATWRLSDDSMIYATASEGYRPGGLNRDPALILIGEFEFDADTIRNYEVGWKSTFADGRVRLNGALYSAEWKDVQYTIFEFALSACCGNVYNLADAEVKGVEFDATIAINDQWLLATAWALNDGKTKGDFVLPTGRLPVPDGTELPNAPDVKGNIWTRYDFNVGNFGAYVQGAWSYTGSSFNEIRPDVRVEQGAFSILNLRGGIDRETWGVDVYINNATDEVAELYVSPRPYEPSTTTNRPRTAGARLWMRF